MENIKQFKSLGTKVLVSAAALIIIIAGLKFAQSILVPFLFALFLCLLGTGPLKWLTKRKVPTSIAVLIITLVIVGILLGIGLFLADSVNSFSTAIPTYRGHLRDFSEQINAWLLTKGMDNLSIVFAESFDPSAVVDIFGSLLKRLVGALSSTFLVIILMIFMLLEAACS